MNVRIPNPSSRCSRSPRNLKIIHWNKNFCIQRAFWSWTDCHVIKLSIVELNSRLPAVLFCWMNRDVEVRKIVALWQNCRNERNCFSLSINTESVEIFDRKSNYEDELFVQTLLNVFKDDNILNLMFWKTLENSFWRDLTHCLGFLT